MTPTDSLAVARRVLAVQRVDLAIVDMDLSANSGVEVVRQIVHRDPLVVSVAFSNDDTHLARALAAGAHGYLLKDQADEVLVAQLNLTLAGVPPLAPVVAQKIASVAPHRLSRSTAPKTCRGSSAATCAPSTLIVPGERGAKARR